MKKTILLLFLAPFVAFAQTPARYDMPALTTTPGQVSPGTQPSLLAVTNATIAVCGYPATMSGGMCTNKITTYTDASLQTACPSTAQLTAPGSSTCVSTTGLQGTFGFWYNSASQGHMTYTVKSSYGTFGPYDIMPPGGSICPGGCQLSGALYAPDIATKLPRVDVTHPDFAGGADPTGVKDSTAAFQAAINFAVAQESSRSGNPSVYCAPGNYKINGTLTIPDYINFVGDGRSTCTLTETNATANLITVGTAAVANPTSGSIRNLTLEGSGSSTTGTLLEVDNTPGYTLENVQLLNNGGRGLQLNGHSERLSSHNLRIDYVRWPIIMPADENESYFVNTQITYPGQTTSGYCYSVNCVNGVAPGPNQGAGGTATPISPDTHAAIYVDGAENFRFLGGSIKPLGYMAGLQNFNSSVGTVDNLYFEGLYDVAWASDSPAIEVGGEAPKTTLSASLSGTGLVVAVASTAWQPEFYEDTANMPTGGDEDGTVYVLMPADYLAGSTAASADVTGVERGQYEKVSIEGFAGDGSLHIYQRNLSGSTAPAGTAWPAGTVVEEAPHTYGGFGAITIASDHFGSQEPASTGYTKNCNQLNTLTCGEIIAGFEPDGYWIDPTGGPNSNLLANVILNGDEMFSGLGYTPPDTYVGQIATHDNAEITIEGYANYGNAQSAGAVTSPYEYDISSSLGGSYITAPTYANSRTAETKVRDLTTGGTWWAAAGIFSRDDASIYGQGPSGATSYMQGKQYANQYCMFDTPSSGTQPLNRFCLDGGPTNSASGFEYDTWNGSGWASQFHVSPSNFINFDAQADGSFSRCWAYSGVSSSGKISFASPSSVTFPTDGVHNGGIVRCDDPFGDQFVYIAATTGGTAQTISIAGAPQYLFSQYGDFTISKGLKWGGGTTFIVSSDNVCQKSGTNCPASVTSVNSTTGAMTFTGAGVTQSGNTFTFSGGGSGATFPATNGLVENTSTTASTTATSAQVVAALNLSPTTQLVTALIPTLNQSTTGNAATATALAATPAQCAAGQFATGITANGTANCGAPSGTGNTTSTTLTTNSLPKANGANSIINSLFADDGTTGSYTGTGGFTAPSLTASGTSNGAIGLKSTGTLPTAAATSTVQLTVPNTVTAYSIELPGANPTTGNTYLSCTAANPSVCSWTTGPMYAVNVKDYGAKGDGTTDDSTAINNATAAATASCGLVYFPAGNYMHSATLTKPRCVVWKGVSTNGTKISYTGTGVAYVEGDTTVNASLSHAGGVEDLTFNGPVTNGATGSTIGAYFGGDPAGTISSASTLDDNTNWKNVVVQNFALGAKAGNNFFLASFIRTIFVNNGSHLLYPAGLTNSGERISFKDSAFVQSSTGSAISINSPLAEFDFDATSFDYNAQSFADFTCTSGGMYVYIAHSHFEKTHGEFIDIPSTCGMNMDISDSYMLENGQNVTPVTQPDLIQFQAGNLGNLTLTIRGTSVYSNDPVTAFIATAANVSKQIDLDGLQWGGLTNANLPVAVNDNGNDAGLTITNTLGLKNVLTGMGASSLASNVAVASSANYPVDPTGANDSTAAIQSMLNAAGTFVESNPYLANATVTTPGGGIVHLKQGLYKVTGTLLYRSGVIFEGEGDGTQIQFCPTAANTDLFAPDTSHWGWNNSMEKPIFRNFSVVIPAGCATASDARYAFNMTNANRSEINSVRIGSGFQIGFYYTLSSTAGQGYYNTITNPWVFGALVNALYVDGPPTVANAQGGNNSINVYGGDFRDISGSFSKSYCVVNKAQSLSIYGTGLECNVTTAQVDAEAPTWLYGGYTEDPGQAYPAPVIDVNDAVSARVNGSSGVEGYLGGIVRMHNVVQTSQIPSANASALVQPMKLDHGDPSPITSQMIVNGNMSAASTGWSTAVSGLATNGTCAQSSAKSLAGFSTFSYAMVNTGAGTLTCGQTTAYTNLAPYTGTDLFFEIWLKTDGNAQNITVSFYGACGSYGSGTGCQGAQITQPVVVRDDGWNAYVFDVPIVSATSAAQSLTWYVEQTGAAANTTLYIGGANAYVGGWEALPVAH